MRSMPRHKLDFIVGLFVLIAAVLTVIIALRTANITEVSAGDGYVVHVRFENVGSLVERAPVKSSGVRVGRVKSIVYDNDDYAAVADIVIEKQYHFPSDSIFSIVSASLLGGQYVSIEVGAEDDNLEDGAMVQGNSALILEELISKFLFDEAGE